MRARVVSLIAMAAALALPRTCLAQSAGSCGGMDVGQLASLNGFVPFQGTSSLWNTDISSAPVDPNSDNIISFIGESATVHADFGSGKYNGQYIGIPYQIVDSSQTEVPIVYGAYPEESDPGPMPVPKKALIEGYPKPNGDRHVLVLDRDSCFLYELGRGFPKGGGKWLADASAVWDMTIDEQRPLTWTSADAAGLPIFPGLVRYDEVAAGAINHAIRFTVPTTQKAFVAPASHWASSNTNPDAPPMGTRLRLKASFDISGFSQVNQIILTALKTYGIILADNGSAIFLTGAPDSRWDNDDLHNLGSITGSMLAPVVRLADQAGLLAWASSAGRAFPSGSPNSGQSRPLSTLTVAGQRGLRTPFPLRPERARGPDRAVLLLRRHRCVKCERLRLRAATVSRSRHRSRAGHTQRTGTTRLATASRSLRCCYRQEYRSTPS